MMGEKQLKQEYGRLKCQTAPDLWDRIEKNLRNHPERENCQEVAEILETAKAPDASRRKAGKSFFSLAAAAVLALIILAPKVINDKYDRSNRKEGETIAAAGQSLLVPENALLVPEDTCYFSEAFLSNTELLCKGTVAKAFFEYDAAGRAISVSYEIALEEIYYAEDYVNHEKTITVRSPIVKSDEVEAYVLYQLQQESTYLLPIQKGEADWRLVYPFAPQIEMTRDGAYLFHSGYTSLVNIDTFVVPGSQEGSSDYYYDRMLMRNDDGFVSDFVALVKDQIQRKSGFETEWNG